MGKCEQVLNILIRIKHENWEISSELRKEITHLLREVEDETVDRPIKLMEEVEEGATIEWWNDNRKKLNEMIRLFNEWQTEHRFGIFQQRIVEAKIVALRKWSEKAGDRGFSEWQIDILDEMFLFIKNQK